MFHRKIKPVMALTTQKNRNSSDIKTALVEGMLTNRNVLVMPLSGMASHNIWLLKKCINELGNLACRY